LVKEKGLLTNHVPDLVEGLAFRGRKLHFRGGHKSLCKWDPIPERGLSGTARAEGERVLSSAAELADHWRGVK
jgi:hypothetical protein